MEVHERIPLEQDDIDYAIEQDQWSCAFARAIQRAHPDATRVRVGTEKTSWTENGHRYYFETPEDVVENVITLLDTGNRKAIVPHEVLLGKPTVKQQHLRTPEERRAHRNKMRESKRDKATNTRKPGPPTSTPNWGRICD